MHCPDTLPRTRPPFRGLCPPHQLHCLPTLRDSERVVGYTTKCQLAQVTFSSKARCTHACCFANERLWRICERQGRSVPDNFLRRLREMVNVPHHCLATVSSRCIQASSESRTISTPTLWPPPQAHAARAFRLRCCESAPEMTLWKNFFPEPALPKASSQELPLGYAGNGSIVILGSIQGRCCTRLTEFHDSTSNVTLAMPVIRSSPCSQRGGTEICPSTSLLSHSSVVPIQCTVVSVCNEDKTTNSTECFRHKELDFRNRVVEPMLSTTRE